jgi:hypothetical protein
MRTYVRTDVAWPMVTPCFQLRHKGPLCNTAWVMCSKANPGNLVPIHCSDRNSRPVCYGVVVNLFNPTTNKT